MMPGFGWWDGGFGIVAIIGIVLMVAFWALIIVGLVLGVRWLVRADRNSRLPGGPGQSADEPLEILRQRYARGEIDDEEFERRKRTLTTG